MNRKENEGYRNGIRRTSRCVEFACRYLRRHLPRNREIFISEDRVVRAAVQWTWKESEEKEVPPTQTLRHGVNDAIDILKLVEIKPRAVRQYFEHTGRGEPPIDPRVPVVAHPQAIEDGFVAFCDRTPEWSGGKWRWRVGGTAPRMSLRPEERVLLEKHLGAGDPTEQVRALIWAIPQLSGRLGGDERLRRMLVEEPHERR